MPPPHFISQAAEGSLYFCSYAFSLLTDVWPKSRGSKTCRCCTSFWIRTPVSTGSSSSHKHYFSVAQTASRILPAHCSVWMEYNHLPLPELHRGLAQVMQHHANNGEEGHAGILGSHLRELSKACFPQHSPRPQRSLPFLLKTPRGRGRSSSRAPSFHTRRLTGQAMPFPQPEPELWALSSTKFPQC